MGYADRYESVKQYVEVFLQDRNRGVHADAHVEVEGACDPVRTTLLFKDLRIRWDEKFVTTMLLSAKWYIPCVAINDIRCFLRLSYTDERLR